MTNSRTSLDHQSSTLGYEHSPGWTPGDDLSRTLEGAGGIGGLLARSDGYSGGNWTTHNYYFADGNGNITYMINSSQAMVASYRYDPYGNTISKSGALADTNVYRFSSKEIHVNSGMYYYGYRFYDPNLQRWVNRDPLDELGFELLTGGSSPSRKNGNSDFENEMGDTAPNLYCFVENKPTIEIDPFGLFFGFGYGRYCGWSRRGPGDPIDEVDAACQKHDNCLATWADACKFKFCNVRFLRDVARANCHGDKACKKAKRKILIGGGIIVPIPPFIWM